MRRGSGLQEVLPGVVVLFSLLLALSCSGAEDAEVTPAAEALPSAMIESSWMLQVAQPGKLDEVLAQKAWGDVFERRYSTAAQGFGSESARGHAESAAIYRQAALLQANAILSTFGDDQRRDTDPAQVTYLVGVASVITGDLQTARASLGQGGDQVGTADAAWAQVLTGDDFSLRDAPPLFSVGEVTAGGAPELPDATYSLPEAESGLVVEVADPTLTLQLAFWHEDAARAAGGEAWLDSWLAPWRLPLESADAQAAELPLDALFLGVWTNTADLDFVNALATDGEGALDAYAATSPYAAIVKECAADPVDVDCLLDKSVALGSQLEGAMEAAYGSQHADHRTFASFARAGVLRAGARLCDARGDERTAAILRLNARDRGTGPATDPKFQLALAAWDASNRNALRSTELFHPNRAAVDGLDVVQVSLDTFSLRVGRETGAGIPQ